MGFKVRGYNKETGAKTKDYSLFVIACEGTEREPEYFRPFDSIDRIKVDIVEHTIGHRDSAPKQVLERAKQYIEKVGFSEADGDTLWFVVDVDKWPREQLEELASFANSSKNCHITISNPCFEVWLLYHKLANLDSTGCSTPTQTKQSLHKLEKGGYYYLNYLPLIETAIQNAKLHDSCPNHHYPKAKETKVYLLADALLAKIGKPRFDKFVAEITDKKLKRR